jgi:hypothetical protein
MNKWASYALWKWKGWFVKIEHNNLVSVFEFKFFVCCFIVFDIPTNFVFRFLAHPKFEQVMLFESEEGDLQKFSKHNNSVCVFEFKLFVHCSITLNIPKKL